MRLIVGDTFANVYEQLLSELWNNPEYVASPRGQKTHEITNMIIQIKDPTSNMFQNVTRSTPKRYLAGELYWYFSGNNTLEFISKYSKFWEKIKNPDGITVNSAYGHLLFNEKRLPIWDADECEWLSPSPGSLINEWQWAHKSLIDDEDSRQAIIRFNKPWHSWYGNKDFVCTLNGIFHIRHGELHLTIIMRSQDEVFGRTFDVPFFTLLQQQMLQHLKKNYPKLKLGTYTQHNISTHIYERDFDKIKEMLKHPFIPDGVPALKENLIWPNGEFRHDAFVSSRDPLITWIKEGMV